jgi:hypothetical protein
MDVFIWKGKTHFTADMTARHATTNKMTENVEGYRQKL